MYKRQVWAKAAPVTVDMSKEEYYTLGAYEHVDLTTFDVVWMRQLPPVDMSYITATYILDHLKNAGVLVTNDPTSIRNIPEKLSIFEFPDLIPPTLVSKDKDQIKTFFETHKDIIVKPLYLFFGSGVERAQQFKDIEDKIDQSEEPLMFQRFIPEIEDGNKRIVLFNGEIIAAAKNIPGKDDFLLERDGTNKTYDLNDRDKEICERIKPLLKKNNVDFAGLDIIGPYLTEINITCVGSLRTLNQVHGLKSESILWDLVEKKAKAL